MNCRIFRRQQENTRQKTQESFRIPRLFNAGFTAVCRKRRYFRFFKQPLGKKIRPVRPKAKRRRHSRGSTSVYHSGASTPYPLTRGNAPPHPDINRSDGVLTGAFRRGPRGTRLQPGAVPPGRARRFGASSLSRGFADTSPDQRIYAIQSMRPAGGLCINNSNLRIPQHKRGCKRYLISPRSERFFQI